MSNVTVHNITDRPNVPGKPRAVRVGGQQLRPGKSVTVTSDALNATFMRLHGSVVWVGPLPARFTRTSRAGLAATAREHADGPGGQPMTVQEVKAHLADVTLSDLRALCGQMSPPLDFHPGTSRPALAARLSRAVFLTSKVLDPQAFFWLRRWQLDRHGDYITKE